MPSLSLLLPVTLSLARDGPAQRTTSGSTGDMHLGEGKVTPSEVGTSLTGSASSTSEPAVKASPSSPSLCCPRPRPHIPLQFPELLPKDPQRSCR